MIEYLDSLPVSGRNLLLLRSAHPALVSHALSQILRGSGPRLVLAASLLLIALTLLWIFAASIGRVATLKALVESIRKRARDLELPAVEPSVIGEQLPVRKSAVRSIAVLSFLRAALALAGVVSVFGAGLLSRLLSSDKHPHPALAFFVFASAMVGIAFAWLILNWFLSLAAVFVERDRKSAFEALSDAERLVRERFGAVFAVGAWFGLAHLTLFLLATSAIGFPLSFAAIVPPGLTLLTMLLITLAYFAMVDGLYIGRLAGYIAIREAPPLAQFAVASSVGIPPYLSTEGSDLDAMVDQQELILSDKGLRESRESSSPSQCDVGPTHSASQMVDQNETILSDDAAPEPRLDLPETPDGASRLPSSKDIQEPHD